MIVVLLTTSRFIDITTPKKETTKEKKKEVTKTSKETPKSTTAVRQQIIPEVTVESLVNDGKTRILVDDMIDIVRYSLSQNSRFDSVALSKAQSQDIVKTVFDTINGLMNNGVSFNIGNRVVKRSLNKSRVYSGNHGDLDSLLGTDDTLLLPGVVMSMKREVVNKTTIKGKVDPKNPRKFTDLDGKDYNLDKLDIAAAKKFSSGK